MAVMRRKKAIAFAATKETVHLHSVVQNEAAGKWTTNN